MLKRRYKVLILISSLSAITYMDRLCIAVAGPGMQRDLNITPEQWGWVLGAFALTYGLLEIPTGALGDRIGQKRVLARIVIWWSVFTSLTGMVRKLGLLIAVRALFGVGEAGAFPNISGVIARWFPKKERARAQGAVWGASRLGGAFAPLIIVPVMSLFGWRQTFWMFGLFGIVWVAFWLKMFKNDPTQSRDIQADAEETLEADRGAVERIPWKAIFGNSQVWLIMVMYWCYVWGSWFYLSWFHTYLVKGRGFTMAEMGLYSPLPFIMGAFGNMLGGYLSDRLSLKLGLKNGRRLVGSACLALSAVCLFLTAATKGKFTGILFLTLGFGIMDCMLPSAWAICLDIGKKYAGAITGAMNSAGNIGGFACSIAFGYLIEISGNYNTGIVVVAILVLISSFLFSRIDAEKKIVVSAQEDRAVPAMP
jgi:sugar phosphate permease